MLFKFFPNNAFNTIIFLGNIELCSSLKPRVLSIIAQWLCFQVCKANQSKKYNIVSKAIDRG